jgi:glycosyltransferase involved in cell wall biosynthesis
MLVVGEFWEDARPYHDLVRQLDLNDAVQFYSEYVPNEQLAVYFSAADVVVLPYLEATQSGVAQIALGFETPVIATSVGGMPETIEDGKTGLIVPPADSAALSNAILKYFQDGLAEPFTHNICVSKESASWMPLVHMIEEIFEPLIAVQDGQAEPQLASPRIL